MSTKNAPKSYILKPNEAGNVLLAAIQRFYAEGKLTDVKISYQNNVLFSCHKLVLASFSTYFESLLVNTEGSAILSLSQNSSAPSDYSKTMRSIVNFMYGYNIQVPKRQCSYLLDTARMFGVSALVKLLEQRMNGLETDDDLISIKQPAVSSLLLVHFHRFRHENKFIDAKIGVVDQQSFPCHKLVLAGFSSYFESLLQGIETSTMLSLEAVDPLYVRQLPLIFDYMYGSPVRLTELQIDVLTEAAKVFGIHSLEDGELCRLRQRARKHQQQRMLQQRLKNLRDIDKMPVQMELTENDATIIRQGWYKPNVQFTLSTDAASETTESTSDSIDQFSTFEDNPVPKVRSPLLSDTSLPSTSCMSESPSTSSLCSGSFTSELFPDISPTPSIDTPLNNIQPGKYMCNQCGQLLKNTQSLDTHVRTKHPVQTAPDPAPVLPTKSQLKRRWFCALCGFSAPNVKLLKSHVAQKHDGSSDICSLCLLPLKSREQLIEHMKQNHRTKIFACPKASCGKEFQTKHGLNCHLQTHVQTGFVCPQCDHVSRNQAALTEHRKQVHNQTGRGKEVAKKHKCSQCDASYLYPSLLERHFKKVHLKLKPFRCPFCSHTASEKAALQGHIRCVHTMEKPFMCEQCGARFATQSHLARHKRQTHGALSDNVCKTCGISFVEKRELAVHINRDHKGERPFKCPECNQGFFRKDHRLIHRRKIHGANV